MAKEKTYITSGERIRNYLGLAFLLSILVNGLAAPLYPNLASHHESDEVEKISETKKVQVRVPTPPPPTPTPPPTP
ncbi:MAG: hypothetical protein WB491_08580, partial [Candidatus Aquilonibacter sp.]